MQIEAYTETGVVTGSLDPATSGPESWLAGPLDLERAVGHAFAGGPADRQARLRLDPDDVLVLCPEAADLPIHASWHSVELTLGPLRVTGELPTIPGFDPGRALSRPGGPQVLLRDVRIALEGYPASGRVERAHAYVNRYAVDRVAADIDLGFFFPGAQFLTLAGAPA